MKMWHEPVCFFFPSGKQQRHEPGFMDFFFGWCSIQNNKATQGGRNLIAASVTPLRPRNDRFFWMQPQVSDGTVPHLDKEYHTRNTKRFKDYSNLIEIYIYINLLTNRLQRCGKMIPEISMPHQIGLNHQKIVHSFQNSY